MHLNLESVIFEYHRELGSPAIAPKFMVLDHGALDPGPARIADVSQTSNSLPSQSSFRQFTTSLP
jgi:hypothetical protein